MQWLSFTKVEKVMLKLQNGWIWTVQQCGRSRRSSRRPEIPLTDQGAKIQGSVRSLQLLKKHEGKAARNPRRSCSPLTTAAGVSKSTMHQMLRDDLGVKHFKILHRQELTENHVTKMTKRCREILHEMTDGTLSNLVVTNKKKFDIQQVTNQQNDQVCAFSSSTEERIVTGRQNPQCVIVWAAVTETGRFPLLFVPTGVKLNSQRYIADILEDYLLPWAKKHLRGVSWSLQQDYAPSNASKISQSCIQRENSFIYKQGSLACQEPWP